MTDVGVLIDPVCVINVDGTKLPETDMWRVREVVVEKSLHLPDMFTIRLHDIGDSSEASSFGLFPTLDGDTFPIGSSVGIDLGREADPETVIKGEVTAVELNVGPQSLPVVVVRGYNKAHRLHRGRQTKSYQNVSDADIVSQVAQQAGLQAETDPTTTIYDHIFQHNQTNWEFLKERADRLGFELFVDDKTLRFRKPQKNQTMTAEQKLWQNLLSLRVSLSTAFQASSVVVRAWDVKNKQAIVGTATSGRLAPDTSVGKTGAEMASTFGDAKVYVVNQPVGTQDEADTLAQSIYDSLDGTYIQAEGVCLGDPTIQPGMTVEMKTLGQKLSGKYYLTSVTHSVTPHDGYTTSFVVSGRQTNSLLELAGGRRDNLALPSVVVGVVTDNTDPDGNMGRVKVKFPWLVDNDQSWWARIASPMAGSQRGFYFLPEVDDEVLVAFEHGDINRPYILGALWNGQDGPPKKNSEVVGNSKVNERSIKTRAGHTITLDDTDGSEKIVIKDKTQKNYLQIESASNTITIQADADVKIVAQGKVEVTAQQDVTVQAQGNASVSASQNVDVKAQGNANVNATGNAAVNANGTLDLKGSSVSIQANGMMSIKASGILNIQGSMVNIN